MIQLINTKRDGSFEKNISEKIDADFKEISFKDDVTVLTYAYNDVLEMAKEIQRKLEGDDQTVFFTLNQDMTEILSVDSVNDSMIDSGYNEDYILHNGFMMYSDYLKLVEEN